MAKHADATDKKTDDLGWVDGFHKAAAKFLVSNDHPTTGSGWGYRTEYNKLTEFATHVQECGIGKVENFSQNAEKVGTFDTFDPDAGYPAVFTRATITCACGEHTKYLSHEGGVNEVIWAVTNSVK
jgi:hypothetical protein